MNSLEINCLVTFLRYGYQISNVGHGCGILIVLKTMAFVTIAATTRKYFRFQINKIMVDDCRAILTSDLEFGVGRLGFQWVDRKKTNMVR